MTTNFYGPIRVLKGVLPTMRAQRSGTVVQMSSILGFRPAPGCSAYGASKSALEGMTETLALDLKPFNIRCVILEPGLFRTGVLTAGPQPSVVGKDYMESAVGEAFGLVGAMIQQPEEHIPGEPAKLGERVVEFVDGTGMGVGLQGHMRLLLGRDAVELAGEKMRVLKGDFEACEAIAKSTDFEGSTAKGVSGVLAF
jgi:NAD(P)-dependent dehydrogenase (short-subunit alcohol dehydrogenase family)